MKVVGEEAAITQAIMLASNNTRMMATHFLGFCS